jgi:hypothetical protein
MRAGYLFQLINLIVSILFVPLLLRYLTVGEYLLWSVFTTLGAVTVQLQNAIQYVSMRQIAYAHFSGVPSQLLSAIHRTRTAYRRLLIIVVGPFYVVGLAYLILVAKPRLGISGIPEWSVFVMAYAVTYHFAPNNAILLGTMRVSTNNHILSATRVLNFIGNYLALKAGLSIAGICLSFLASQLVGAAAGARQARGTLETGNFYRSTTGGSGVKATLGVQANIRLYAIYMIASFALYNGSLLLATALFPKSAVATYALGLQSNTMLLALAQVPVQVWLSRFVRAIASSDNSRVLRELSVTLVTCNGVFVGGFASLAIFGDLLLRLIGSHVMLPGIASLLVVSAAFLVELNISLMINFLVNKGNYRFVRVYAVTSGIAILFGFMAASISGGFMLGLIAVPLILQTTIALPSIMRITCTELRVTRKALVQSVGASLVNLCRTGHFPHVPDVARSGDGS